MTFLVSSLLEKGRAIYARFFKNDLFIKFEYSDIFPKVSYKYFYYILSRVRVHKQYGYII